MDFINNKDEKFCSHKYIVQNWRISIATFAIRLYTSSIQTHNHRRTGRHFTGGAEKIALKIAISPESNLFSLIRMGPETSCKSVLYVEFVYNGFVCNVNSPMTLHFVRSRWHLLHAFKFAYNVISATTFFTQSPRGAVIGKFCSYLAC